MGHCFSKGKVHEPVGNGYGDWLPQQQPKPSVPPTSHQTQQSHHSQHAHHPLPPKPEARYAPASPNKQVPPSPPRLKPALAPGSILGKPFEDVNAHYTLGKELGRGQFGVTYLCTDNATGHHYVCKSISKRKLSHKSDKEDVKREIQMMQHLSGQPNIVEFKGRFEDKHSVHVMMELCTGRELFARIIAKGHYSERAAATICRSIVNVVHIWHFMGVMHRDLKPENFLLSTKDERAMLKATDFGSLSS